MARKKQRGNPSKLKQIPTVIQAQSVGNPISAKTNQNSQPPIEDSIISKGDADPSSSKDGEMEESSENKELKMMIPEEEMTEEKDQEKTTEEIPKVKKSWADLFRGNRSGSEDCLLDFVPPAGWGSSGQT